RTVKLLNESSLDPVLKSTFSNFEEFRKEHREALRIGLCLRDVPVKPHHVNTVARKRLSIEVFTQPGSVAGLETGAAAGNLGQVLDHDRLYRNVFGLSAHELSILVLRKILLVIIGQLSVD